MGRNFSSRPCSSYPPRTSRHPKRTRRAELSRRGTTLPSERGLETKSQRVDSYPLLDFAVRIRAKAGPVVPVLTACSTPASGSSTSRYTSVTVVHICGVWPPSTDRGPNSIPLSVLATFPEQTTLQRSYRTVTLEQPINASFFASTMHQSPPNPPEALSYLSPSATLILS